MSDTEVQAATASDEIESHGDEFERRPVPARSLLGFRSFIGMYAGEHCAGTELMIGPLFVAAGVGAFDLLAGLFVGNLLAVLSWVFLTAPIATRSRLTMYFQLEKITGRKLVILYNLANGVMFCFLAGAMITVSATAVGVWFKFPMPGLNDVFPNSAGWVIAVLAVGAAIAVVAAYGYRMVAHFANIAAPWMIMVFVAFGLVGLREFISDTGVEIQSASDLWNLFETKVWKGGDPQPGQAKFTFWHVTFFAWFCNLAMHIGMADLSVLRFAKKTWYGVASGTGMYIGHFMAWISASILYALQLYREPGNTDVLPGPLAYNACGIAGLICVIIAGWTTANPTIYRAGLAFQAIFPKVSRRKMTLVTGGIATVAALFPLIAMKLLGFVALYGLVLVPMGAVIFVDFWLMRKLGLKDNYAESSGKSFNWAACLAWLLTLAVCLFLVLEGGVEIYFVSLPGWFLAAMIFVLVSWIHQKNILNKIPGFRKIVKSISLVAFAATVVPAFLYLSGNMELGSMKYFMLSAAALWFLTTPYWMDRS